MQLPTILLALTATLTNAAALPPYPLSNHTSASTTSNYTMRNATDPADMLLPRSDETGSILRTTCSPAGLRNPKRKAWRKTMEELQSRRKQIALPAFADNAPGHAPCHRVACNWNTGVYLCNPTAAVKHVDTDTVYGTFMKSAKDVCSIYREKKGGDFDGTYGFFQGLGQAAKVESNQGWYTLWAGTPPNVSC